MKRIIVDYKNLTKDILGLLVEKYPYGYEYDDIITFQNSEGKTINAVEVKTIDTVFLVKISRELEETMDDYMYDDSSFEDDISDNFNEDYF